MIACRPAILSLTLPGFRAGRNNVLTGRNTPSDLYAISHAGRVFDHDHGICSGWQR